MLEAILTVEGIDWYGQKWSSGAPVPVLRRGSPALQAAEKQLAQCEADEKHAARDALATHLYKLQGHYWQPNMPDALARSVAQDFAHDLAGVSEADLGEACRQWRTNPDNQFFPKPGQLLKLIGTNQAMRRWKARKLRALLDAAQ